MNGNRLQDDLIREFREEKKLVNDQIERFDPLATSLRKPAAQRLLSAGFLILLEVVFYVLSLASIAAIFFSDKLYPLYMFTRFKRPEYVDMIGRGNVDNLFYWMIGMLIAFAVLFFIIARNLHRIRVKNVIINRAGSVVKHFVGELLTRKAAINALEQRHFHDLPQTTDVSSVHTPVQDVPNPGYDTSHNTAL